MNICYDCLEYKDCFHDEDGQKRCHDCYGKKHNKRIHDRTKEYLDDMQKQYTMTDLKQKWEKKF